ncbi:MULTISPECIES: cytochrome P450 [unclassified Nodularia (in: cyanobacteria)]|uniref:cytochrome P450 n=1 Tax=unclassified Nodularia (in: cyanobacteria) TaxID=2656917 RepID=UPI001881A7D3|nr:MULTISPECIES: cytochrome P450 [unclassified Nodularia (in: cyanobacteria)]MBE9200768.1 cytochrome P450 [Nodularia sp. LEGE 06071]MCC2692087.1 cytochrome P450 [Nodularia sp. LEGE 04288]
MPALQLPDGPKNHPWLQTYRWLTSPLEYMEDCAKSYGDIFTLRVGPLFTPQVFVSNPEAIQQIFNTDPKHLDCGAAAGFQSPLLGNQSLLSLDGKPHQRQRKLLTPPFHGERMLAYGDLIRDISQQVTNQWQVGETVSVLSSMQAISFQVILKAVFGLAEGPRYEKLKQLLIAILNPKKPILRSMLVIFPSLRRDLGAWSHWGEFLRLRQQIDELIYAEIQERQAQSDSSRTDILSLMMATRDEAGKPMTDVELRDELMTLLLTGQETTATALTWALYWIHHQPEVREKLLPEIDSLGENSDSNAIFRLPYLNAVCAETLRLYPVTMLLLSRLVKSPLQIGEYQFAPGTLLIPCVYLTHHREDLYPDSQTFKPERFLERQFSSSEYIPFGGGNRRCIGMAFALFEMKLVLATVLSKWQMELADSQPVQPIRKGILFGPKGGVPMVIKGTPKN